MIIINSPHNPTGMLFTEQDMLQLQKITSVHDLLEISSDV